MKVLLVICIIMAGLFFVGKRILFPRYEEIKVTGPYEIACEDYWVTEGRPDPFRKDGSFREVQVRAWYPKGDDAFVEKIPVVVASHGSCGSIDNNLSLYRELASHGYVVLEAGHPGHAMDVVHSNGKKESVSMYIPMQAIRICPSGSSTETTRHF